MEPQRNIDIILLKFQLQKQMATPIKSSWRRTKMQPDQSIDPLQMLIGKHVVYLDKNQASRLGKLKKINKCGTCMVEQRITVIKQRNGRYYPPIRHRIDRDAITGVLSRDRQRTMPLMHVNAGIVKKADKKGVELNHDQMLMPSETITFSKTICKSEAFHGFLVIAKKCKLNVGDPLTIHMNKWRIKTHVQKVNRIWMTKEMHEMNIQEGDKLDFIVNKKAGITTITATEEVIR